MDFTEKRRVPNPQLKANPISKYFFFWITPLLRKGTKKDLSIDDLYDRLPEDDASTLADRLQRIWETECKRGKRLGRKPSFLHTCMRFFGMKFFYLTMAVVFNELVLKMSQPFILREMIRAFSTEITEDNRETVRNKQYIFTATMIIVTFFYALNLHHIYLHIIHLAMKGRIACNSVIYRKLFRLNKTVLSENASIGKLVNLIASDSNRFDNCFFHCNMLIVGPLQLIILSYFLYDELGIACFAGLGIISGVLIPFQVVVGRFSAKYRAQVATRTDQRGRMINEIIMGIRIIKMYAWESCFGKVIHKLREYEIAPIRKASYLKGTFQSVNSLGKITIPFFTFLTYVALGNELTPEKAYFSISIFHILIAAMSQKIPTAVAQTAELKVAIDRIEGFLNLEEMQSQTLENEKNRRLSKEIVMRYEKEIVEVPRINLVNVSASWTKERRTLQNISINLSGNMLVMIIGKTGTGKSSLLNLIISELSVASGTMTVSGKLSYASQEAWIFTGTIRQNILFGSLYDRTRYDSVIKTCGLQEDLQQFPSGDETIVGERGISLSGGQKARVNLARTLYRKSQIYLLDDPLSAVDSKTSRHIFQCLKEFDGLRLLVTHQLQYLEFADHIIVLDEMGSIAAQGAFPELKEKQLDFLNWMNQDDYESDVDADDTPRGDVDNDRNSSSSASTSSSENSLKSISETTSTATNNNNNKMKPFKESRDEKMQSGSVTWKTYLTYVKFGDSRVELITVITCILLAQVIVSFTDKWLSMWTNDVSRRSLEGEASTSHSEGTYITVYSCSVGAVVVIVSMRAILFFHYSMSISVNLHDKMFNSLVRAPVKFFDKNPSGRIINRFTRDLNICDEQLPMTLNDCINVSLYVIGVIAVVISTNYYLGIPSVLLLIILWKIRNYYVQSARSIKRIESVTKSPIFLHLSASVQGLSTIRGLGAEQIVVDQFDSYLDINTSPSYLVSVGNRWMGASMDASSVAFLACVAGSFIIFQSEAEGGSIGMAITLTLNLLTLAQWGMRQTAETENHMTSAERVLEYCSNIPPEADLGSKGGSPKNWPSNGAIKFDKVSLSYNGHDPVLKDLTFEIKGKEKVGIVGRTGAGKSSILVALFRLTEPQGEIFIDGISIKRLGLHDLRTKISIIPQDPVLFSGTMRYNLDPFDEFKDAELWEALREVNLVEAVPSLDFKITDGGGNYSVGQRQLVCLARAILRKNKIIVLDEATANVDPVTDNLIQDEIRRKFSDCTILTIAHRLHTIIDNDRIIVMDNGKLEEFDTPLNLLKNPEGLFTQMVNQTGSLAESNLRNIATG